MSLKDFDVLSKLGEGAYSSVYKVIRHEDQKLYALKRVKIYSLSPKQQQNALNQIRILASIRNPNVIGYKQAFVDEATKSLCIVMQFANYGDLAYRIAEKKKNGGLFQQAEIWNIFIHIVKGLNELHQLNIFHRDIKSANVFLQENNTKIQAKLGDMNVSKISQRGLCMTQTGTPYYASPEVWKDQPYDPKSDIWSLGCVLYQMITLKPPFRAEDMESLFKKVTRGIYQRIPSQFSNQLSSMIRSLLQVNPDSRPTCQKILKMPIIVKKMKQKMVDNDQHPQLIRTIRHGQNFGDLNQSLPKPNYNPIKSKKQKAPKNCLLTIQDKTLSKITLKFAVTQVESLPVLQKQKKIKAGQNSDRVCLKDKQTINMTEKDRKKSEMADRVSRIGLQISGTNKNSLHQVGGEISELKLPKVHNRYNRCKQRINKQNSLKAHKIYS